MNEHPLESRQGKSVRVHRRRQRTREKGAVRVSSERRSQEKEEKLAPKPKFRAGERQHSVGAPLELGLAGNLCAVDHFFSLRC